MKVEARPAFDLRALFAPRSIAVVGASPRSDLATTVRDNIARVGGTARCYFVNPRYDAIDGTPCHPDLASLPEVPDTVLIAVNPLRAASLTTIAAAAGVPAVVIPGGGVVEGGEAAARMQAEVAAVAAATGTAVLGPNCMGVIDLTTHSATYIDDLPPTLRRGGVAGIAQSGSVTDAFVHAGTRIGWSRIVSCGSEAVLDICDYLAHSLADPETHAVVLFVEGFKRPERFLALADHALELGKTILAIKVGRSRQAQEAAIAHTGSLAGEDRVTDAALRAAGVVRCDDLDDLLEAAALVTGSRRLGRGVGAGRTAVVTVSTGEGSLIADLASRTGVDLPPIPAAARSRIVAELPTLGYVGNPLDPWGAGEAAPTYRSCFEALADSGAYDVVALVHDFPFRSQPGEVALATELAGELVRTTAALPAILPVFVSLTSGDATPEVLDLLDGAGGIPALRGTTAAFASIARLAWWERRRANRRAAGPARSGWPALAADVPPYGHDGSAADPIEVGDGDARDLDGGGSAAATGQVLSERASLDLLRAAGLPVVRVIAIPIEGVEESAAAAAESLGWPVVVKLDADGLAHKTEIGGVVVGVEDPAGVRRAVRRVLGAARSAGVTARGVLVQPAVPLGVELIVGARRDRQFGPVVVVGLGGILAEVMDDVAIRLAPVALPDAREMLDDLRGAAILHGVRGRPAVDLDRLAAFVVELGQAIADHPDWREVDVNPLIAGSARAIAVDALVILEADAVTPPTRRSP
ncbi:MAG: acetate--CoA ligase family protein [Chloroflexi bacterium]|nr:acetate--CoA ligase family protein [Chloroflexota bacterium]